MLPGEEDGYLFEPDEPTQAPIPDFKLLREVYKSVFEIISARIIPLTGYEDINFRLDDIKYEKENGNKDRSFIVKISNPVEAKTDGLIEAQLRLCEALKDGGIPVPECVVQSSGERWSWQRLSQPPDNPRLPVRAFRILPGYHFEDVRLSEDFLRQIGALLAQFHTITDKFANDQKFAPFKKHVPFMSIWNRASILREVDILHGLGKLDSEKTNLLKRQIDSVADTWTSEDLGIIHSDFNETNVLVVQSTDGQTSVSGLLDFGDTHFGPRSYDIASAALYILMADRKIAKSDENGLLGLQRVMERLIEGYRSLRRLEFAPESVVGFARFRLAASLTYGLRTHRIGIRRKKAPEDEKEGAPDYILKTQQDGWQLLQELGLDRS